MRVEGGLKLGS